MTYINYMNQLWRSAMMSPIPASEIALFAYLVNECNKRFWQMPFACSTTRISNDLCVSRQTVITAREHLVKRRLISFTEGKSRHVASIYMLINWTDDLTVELTDGLTHDLTHLKDKEKDNLIILLKAIQPIFHSKKGEKMETTYKIDVEALKKSLLQRRPMKERFKLPMAEEEAYAYLLAEFMVEVENRHRTFCSNEYLETQLHDIANWLTSPSSHFGIMLCGGCGNGKSTMLKAFQKLLNDLRIPKPHNDGTYGIQIVDAKYIVYLCKNNYDAYRNLIKVDMLGIDDLGTEPSEVMDYGNVYTPVIDLLTKRYEEQLFTVITTNLTPQQIRGHYGDRIADRLNEMVKKIVFNNGTYRTNISLI